MMDEKGHLKLIDFGLCKRIRNAAEVKVLLRNRCVALRVSYIRTRTLYDHSFIFQ
jgi:hypothetical protein